MRAKTLSWIGCLDVGWVDVDEAVVERAARREFLVPEDFLFEEVALAVHDDDGRLAAGDALQVALEHDAIEGRFAVAALRADVVVLEPGTFGDGEWDGEVRKGRNGECLRYVSNTTLGGAL